jgi:hypothetical protein
MIENSKLSVDEVYLDQISSPKTPYNHKDRIKRHEKAPSLKASFKEEMCNFEAQF